MKNTFLNDAVLVGLALILFLVTVSDGVMVGVALLFVWALAYAVWAGIKALFRSAGK